MTPACEIKSCIHLHIVINIAITTVTIQDFERWQGEIGQIAVGHNKNCTTDFYLIKLVIMKLKIKICDYSDRQLQLLLHSMSLAPIIDIIKISCRPAYSLQPATSPAAALYPPFIPFGGLYGAGPATTLLIELRGRNSEVDN